MKVFKIQLKDEPDGIYFIETIETLPNFIDSLNDLEIGDGYTITAIEMSEEEYNNTEEFTGF